MRHRALFVLGASCARLPPAEVGVEPKSSSARVEQPLDPAPPPLPTSIPAHGIASLELVCELIVKVADQIPGTDPHSCRVEDGVFDDDRRAGVLTAHSTLSYDLPVIKGKAGWSVFPPVLNRWDSGAELNVERLEVLVGSQPTALGELFLLNINAVTTDDRDKSRKPVSSYEAQPALDGGDLVLVTNTPEPKRLYASDEGIFLSPGPHPLEQLLAERAAWER